MVKKTLKIFLLKFTDNYNKASKLMCEEGTAECWMGCRPTPTCGPDQELTCYHNDHWECVNTGKPDCNYFLNRCSELCNHNVLNAECWGNPLYAYCKCTNEQVFHIPGYTCEHSTCPADAI